MLAMGERGAGIASRADDQAGTALGSRLDDGSVDRLAEVLHAKMEHLDPTDGPSWVCMSEHDREFYRACVEAVLIAAMRADQPRSHRRAHP
jgi:hypothetical protein